MITDPRDYRLFHYTKKRSHLVDILADGIWPRFSEEEFTWVDGVSELYLAFQIVCFCDIPISMAWHHRQKYGRYAVAIHKNYVQDIDVTPVWYIRSDGDYTAMLKNRIPRDGRFTLVGAKHSDLFPFLPLMKITTGTQPSRNGSRVELHEGIDFTEECEWRHVARGLSSDEWKEGYRRGFTTAADHGKTQSLKIKLTPEMVDAVYVFSKKDIEDIRIQFPAYAQKIKQWPKHK